MAWEVRYVIVGSTISFIFPFLYLNMKLGFFQFPILLLLLLFLCLVLTSKCHSLKVFSYGGIRNSPGGHGASGGSANNDSVSDGAPLPPICDCEQLVVVQTTLTMNHFGRRFWGCPNYKVRVLLKVLC
ncbi:hypothetical protein AAZV13_02G146100 [Glycine max]